MDGAAWRQNLPQIVRLSDDSLNAVSQLEHGVVFYHAEWAAHSHVTLRTLCKLLSEVPEARFPILIVDIDAVKSVSMTGDVLHGQGETYWIRQHKVAQVVRGFYRSIIGGRGALEAVVSLEEIRDLIRQWCDNPPPRPAV